MYEVVEISENEYRQFDMTVSMMMLFGLSAAGMSYMLSFFFKHSNVAMAVNNLLFSITGIVMWIAGSILGIDSIKQDTIINFFGNEIPIIDLLDPIFSLFPA